MSRAMVRGVVAGALALAAVGGVAGLGAADARASASPFAGTYWGDYSIDSWPAGPIEVSKNGDISGSYRYGTAPRPHSEDIRYLGRITGQVLDDGTMSVRGWFAFDSGGSYGGHIPFEYSATVHLDGSGNLVGISDSGRTFTWLR